jgi:glycosyltransferase involved in cell wall biosynthesis
MAAQATETTMLTVVVPNFNHGRFLPHALGALLAQTRPADEVIIIDDASRDDSVEVIKTFLPKFQNARLIRNSENLGIARNMNVGVRMAQGSSLVFAAADDVTYPLFFERMMALLHAYPQAGFASARTALIDEAGRRIGVVGHSNPLDGPGYVEPKLAAYHLMRDDAWFTGNATVFRRDPILSVGGFPEDLSAITDSYVSRLLAVKYGACFTPEILVAWRRMEGGAAWSYIDDIAKTRQFAELAESRMRETGLPFAPGYPKRWKQRFLFGVRRFSLGNARRKARSKGAWQFVYALAREIIETGWLFATLRPQDTIVVLGRWAKELARKPGARRGSNPDMV